MAYIKRAAEETVKKISSMFPVLLVTGPRQAGKTTMLRKLAAEEEKNGIRRNYITLDDPEIRSLAKNDPAEGFRNGVGAIAQHLFSFLINFNKF